MLAELPEKPPSIAYLFTTFPKSTETFLQREIIALQALGANLRIYSIHGGGGVFRGLPVERFSKWRLLELFWKIPWESARRPGVLLELLRGLADRRAPSWINFWENLLGAGFACVYARHFRKDRPALMHAAWAGAPATAAWILWRVNGIRYSAAAHAYDIYEHGGDWWLGEKLRDAIFIHTSTEMARRALVGRGVPDGKIVCIRRGLEALPAVKPLRTPRSPLRLVCVARLVEKKGLRHQLRLYAAWRDEGFPFAACIVGDGPLRGTLEKLAHDLGLDGQVAFTGHLSQLDVQARLAWADVLIHTGVVAPSGDRDGLPNVIPEAMAAGTLVLTSPTAATTEAVTDGITGLIAPVNEPGAWLVALRRLAEDDGLAAALRAGARRWVEENFDAHKNAARLYNRFLQILRP
ncbi:MAG TPA: glycosyltransferase [Opitutaceae bacterium]|nr:glycosyltransferase [Opitutaceae bacterium]